MSSPLQGAPGGEGWLAPLDAPSTGGRRLSSACDDDTGPDQPERQQIAADKQRAPIDPAS